MLEYKNTMTLPRADTLVKAQPQFSVEQYITERINSASSAGYSSTRMWVKNESLPEANQLLTAAGYKLRVVVTEERSVQLEVWW